jgi:hypothetical protein
MGNVTLAEELTGSDELDELYRLDASESAPEEEGDGDGEDDEDIDEDGGDEDGGGPFEPEDIPHG